MYICNYCNRHLKEEYEVCPGCGATSFKTKSFLGEIVMSEPPKDGYKLNVSNFETSLKHQKKTMTICIIISLLIIIISALYFIFLFPITEDVLFITPLFLILAINLIVAFLSRASIKKNNDELKRLDKLSKIGTLVKALPFEYVNTGTLKKGIPYKCIKVVYKNSNNIEIPIYSETKYDYYDKSKNKKDNETVDLLIDLEDYSNYFIDYEIY